MSADASVTVLVVSERIDWRTELARRLKEAVYDVVVDDRGDEALAAAELPADVVVLDLRLASRPAIEVCIDLRSRGPIPVLAVHDQGAEHLLLSAYEAGADVVVDESIGHHELLSRLRALARHQTARSAGRRATDEGPAPMTLLAESCAVVIEGNHVRLTEPEFLALGLLLRQPGRVVTRRELTAGWRVDHPDRRLDFVIRRLRYKLESADPRRRIVVVRGHGFRLLTDDVVSL